MLPDDDICYRALVTRDARFDGLFFTCVTTTGIFCRPVCPAPTPKRENCRFTASAAAAFEAGFRPCLRCLPEKAPSITRTDRSASIVERALGLIDAGALDEGSIADLASELGVAERHLRRLFTKELGVSPISVVQTRRLLFAKQLLDETSLPIVQVALGAGFKSLRRFNDVMRTTYQRSPRELRRHAHRAPAGTGITLKLPYVPPYDWDALTGFLAPRAIPGVESVTRERYARTIELDGEHGMVEVAPCAGENALRATITIPDVAALLRIVDRLRAQFDLGANAPEIAAHLARDPRLKASARRRPGLRVPGAWDRFELAVRAILGQQVSVAAATTLAGRIVRTFGTPLRMDGDAAAALGLTHLFPAPEALADADLTGIGLTRTRAETVRAFAAAVAHDPALLRDPAHMTDCAVRKLTALPGIGSWTAQYIAMRALRQPDAFPASDLWLKRAIEATEGPVTPKRCIEIAEAWRPWRAYAAFHLWSTIGETTNEG
ncbi:MAG TPA: AlkA N-terminal domain-containing protein [Candidatus Kapabacteria bacterium]|nr:AlkA N-terminal domain-containing protein [Candidatus Kapabacteria bacterium]